MKIAVCSDVHLEFGPITLENPGDVDVLILSGDIIVERDLDEWSEVQAENGFSRHRSVMFHTFFQECAAAFPHVIYVAGNHDWLFQKDPQAAKMLLSEHPDVIYLQDASITLEGLRIYGSPWQPWFYDWAFNANSDKLFLLWEKIPGNTDILLTHGPPHDILDLTKRNDKVGCEILKQNILNRVKPRIHAFGHIHESRGTLKVGDTTFVNSSCLDERYSFKNEPIVMEI